MVPERSRHSIHASFHLFVFLPISGSGSVQLRDIRGSTDLDLETPESLGDPPLPPCPPAHSHSSQLRTSAWSNISCRQGQHTG